MDFILAIAKSLLSSLGAKMLTSIFPPGPPNYFQTILDDIQNLLHISEVSNDLVLIKGTVDGVIGQMTNDYVHLKAKESTTNAELITFLTGVRNTLEVNVMGPLAALTDQSQAKGNAQQSLLAYLFDGSLLFSVLQEMALHDPQAATPNDSQYAQTLAGYAADYQPYAANLLTALKASRMAAVIGPGDSGWTGETQSMARPEAGPEFWPSIPPQILTTYLVDTWINQKVCSYTGEYGAYDTMEQVWAGTYNLRPAYMEAVGKQFDSDWANATQTIAAWETLQTTPLPTQSTA